MPFADVLGLRGWYEWKPDPGTHQVTEAPPKEGHNQPRTPAAEICRNRVVPARRAEALRTYGRGASPHHRVGDRHARTKRLDYASPDKKYTLQYHPR